jgi:biopolymer transport protein ExbD
MRLFIRPIAGTAIEKRRTPPPSTIDVSAFVSVMFALLFLLMFGNMYPMHPRYAPADVPVTAHSRLQPGAPREDALEVAITRDGQVYFRNQHILPAELPDALRDGARHGAEKIVYVKVDARAKYGDVKAVLDQIRQSGLQNIAFLTEQRTR